MEIKLNLSKEDIHFLTKICEVLDTDEIKAEINYSEIFLSKK